MTDSFLQPHLHNSLDCVCWTCKTLHAYRLMIQTWSDSSRGLDQSLEWFSHWVVLKGTGNQRFLLIYQVLKHFFDRCMMTPGLWRQSCFNLLDFMPLWFLSRHLLYSFSVWWLLLSTLLYQVKVRHDLLSLCSNEFFFILRIVWRILI